MKKVFKKILSFLPNTSDLEPQVTFVHGLNLLGQVIHGVASRVQQGLKEQSIFVGKWFDKDIVSIATKDPQGEVFNEIGLSDDALGIQRTNNVDGQGNVVCGMHLFTQEIQSLDGQPQPIVWYLQLGGDVDYSHDPNKLVFRLDDYDTGEGYITFHIRQGSKLRFFGHKPTFNSLEEAEQAGMETNEVFWTGDDFKYNGVLFPPGLMLTKQ